VSAAELADVIAQAARTEHDFGGWLADVLAGAAAQLGSADALVAGRPGSWEAALVLQLVHGTVGWDDESLSGYAAPESCKLATFMRPDGSASLTRQDVLTVLGAIATAAEYLEYRASLTCPDCENSPAEVCDTHASDLDVASEYRAVAVRLEEDR
jgi:hypothetical protein